jgi:hypothetical protein
VTEQTCEGELGLQRGKTGVEDSSTPLRYRPLSASVVEPDCQPIELKNRVELIAHLRRAMNCYNARWNPPDPIEVSDHMVETRPYEGDHVTESRPTHIVTVKGWGVMGLIDTREDS